jgi:hypothetical protein
MAQDWMHPDVSKDLMIYPQRRSDGVVSEIWHADKLLKEVDDQLCPHYIAGARHFYVNEFARLTDGTFAIPKRWVMVDTTLCAESFCLLEIDNTGVYRVDYQRVDIPYTNFSEDFLTLEDRHAVPSVHSACMTLRSIGSR